MSNLARINIYVPQLLFFEMQHVGQTSVSWFSGPYNTYKIKWSKNLSLELWKQKLQVTKSCVDMASAFYATTANKNRQWMNKKISLWHITLRHWLMGALIGFQNALRLRGVGYRFDLSSLKIAIQVGYSHLVIRQLPQSPFLKQVRLNKKSTLLKIKSSNLAFLHTFLSNVRNSRKPDVYKGKGIRFQKDLIFRKEGKKKKTN